MKNNDELTRDILKRRDEHRSKKRKIFTASACTVCAAAAVFAGGTALSMGTGFGRSIDLTPNASDAAQSALSEPQAGGVTADIDIAPGVTELYREEKDGYIVKLLKNRDDNVTSILASDRNGRIAEIELSLENCGLPSPNASGNYVKVKTFKLKDENEYVVMAYMAPSEQVEGAAANALFFSLNEKSFETGKMEVYKADGETPYYAYAMNDGCANLGNTLFIPFGGGYCLTFDPDTLSVTHSELAAVEVNSAVIDAPEVGLSDVHVWIAKGERPLEDGIIGDVTVILASDGTGRTAITAVSYDDYDYDKIDLLTLDKSNGEFLILMKSDAPTADTNSVPAYCARFYALNAKTFETGEIRPYVLKDAPEDYPAPWVTDGFEVTEQAYTCRDSVPPARESFSLPLCTAPSDKRDSVPPARETFFVFDPETMTYTEKEDKPELPESWTISTDTIDGYHAQFTVSGIAYEENSDNITNITADKYEITVYAPDGRTLKIDCGEIPLIQDENGGFVLLFRLFKLEQTEGEYLLVFEPPAWSLPRCNALFYAVNEKAFETGKAEQYQADPSDLYGFLLTGDCDMIAGTNTLYDSFGDGYKLTFDPETLTFTAKEDSPELPESQTVSTDTLDNYTVKLVDNHIVVASDDRGNTAQLDLNDMYYNDIKLMKLGQSEGEYVIMLRMEFEVDWDIPAKAYKPYFFALNRNTFETGGIEIYSLKEASGEVFEDAVTDDLSVVEGSDAIVDNLTQAVFAFDTENLEVVYYPAIFNG